MTSLTNFSEPLILSNVSTTLVSLSDSDFLHFLHFVHAPLYLTVLYMLFFMWRKHRLQHRPLPTIPRTTSFERALADSNHPINSQGVYIDPREP